MADKTTPHGDHIAGDKIGRDKIDTQINHYHRHYYGADKQREHELHRLYLRGLFQKTWAEVSLAEFGTDNQRPHLCQVYVPLPVDLQLTVRVHNDQVIDWWVGGDSERPGSESAAREKQTGTTLSMILRNSDGHKLDVDQLQRIVDGIQRQVTANAAARQPGEKPDKEPRNRTYTLKAEDIASLNDALVVLGAPGSGKSSFAHHYALRMAGDLLRSFGERPEHANATLGDLWNGDCRPVTPIYIELRDLIATEGIFPELPKDDKKPAAMPREDALWQYLRKSENGLPENLHGLLEPLQKMLTEGEALVILDGLDEVDRASDRRRLDQIQAFVRGLRKTYRARVLVTSRPYAYNTRTQAGEQPWRLEGFGVANLIDLESDTMRALAEAAFRPASVDGDQAKTLAEQFMSEVARVPDSLRSNPLFLTMLAGLWWGHKDSRAEGERLPRTEADLYRQSLEHLLTRWTSKPGNTKSVEEELGLTTGQLRLALQVVALETQRESALGEDSTIFDKKRLREALQDINDDIGTKKPIDYLQTKAGVLLSPSPDQFRFAHRSFQEHLAACELLGESDQPPTIGPLVGLVCETPALWRNVMQHAGDELVRRERVETLWELIRALTDPWLAGAQQTTAVQPALLALQNAERHGLLTKERNRRDPHRADLEDLQGIALALMTDLRMVAKERASAGRCLAKLGDPRVEVMDVRAIAWLPVHAGRTSDAGGSGGRSFVAASPCPHTPILGRYAALISPG